jgi:transcriptional regulator with PAS, ATPase and Fis domain
MRSPAMLEVDRVIRAVAPKEVAISIVGESGSGKEILARRVHELSHRRAGPFVPINCAAIPETLFESELFGHERGAFTGASERAPGKLEASAGGTLFLDEIGEMPLGVQAKLLRFIENRKFMRVGGSSKISVDARLVSATLRPLEQEVQAGRFRADLYYRIQGISVTVPPLRERPHDLVPLVHQFVAELSAKHSVPAPRLSRTTMAALASHSWPGNIRELRNVIELVCLLRPGKQVRPADLPPAIRDHTTSGSLERSTPSASLEVDLNRGLHEIVQQVLHRVLELEDGNRSRAARRLGISLRTVQRHLARLPPVIR